MGWRALIVPVLAGVGFGLAACSGAAIGGPDARWYRDGYNFGVAVDQHGSPYVQVDSPTQFCNAALGSVDPDHGSAPAYRISAGTNVPRIVPPVSDNVANSAWLAGCVAGVTSEE